MEPVLRGGSNEISLLVAGESVSVTHASRVAGEPVTEPHIHRHTEVFCVLEGELAFAVGSERETIMVGAGAVVAVPPGVAHSYGTAGTRRIRWLVIHAPDGGFATFLRGIRDGFAVEWDVAAVPADGGRSANAVIVSRPSTSR